MCRLMVGHDRAGQGRGGQGRRAAYLNVTKAEGTAELRALRCSILIKSARQASLSGQNTRASTMVSVVPYLRSPHIPYWGPTTFTCIHLFTP